MLQASPGRRARTAPTGAPPRWPHRRLLVVGESVVAIAGLAGSVMLVDGRFAPPVSDLAPLGLTSWTLPGAWLAATVTVPAAVAGFLTWRRSPRAPAAVVVAGVTMGVEVLVQIPFVGPSPLQAVVGGTAIALPLLAVRARRTGWGAGVT